jgi:hypothetical protein
MGNMMVMLPAIFIMNKVDLKEGDNPFYLRIAYCTVQIISVLAAVMMYFKIKEKKDQTKITFKAPSPGFGAPEGEERTITVEEYDQEALQKFAKGVVMGACIVGFIHYKWGMMPPLFLQSLMGPMNLYNNPLFKLHILGKSGEGLERPFKEPESPFAGLKKGLEDATGAETPAVAAPDAATAAVAAAKQAEVAAKKVKAQARKEKNKASNAADAGAEKVAKAAETAEFDDETTEETALRQRTAGKASVDVPEVETAAAPGGPAFKKSPPSRKGKRSKKAD